MRVIACTEGASLGMSETECSSATRSNEGIAAARFPLTDSSVETTMTTSHARMISSANL